MPAAGCGRGGGAVAVAAQRPGGQGELGPHQGQHPDQGHHGVRAGAAGAPPPLRHARIHRSRGQEVHLGPDVAAAAGQGRGPAVQGSLCPGGEWTIVNFFIFLRIFLINTNIFIHIWIFLETLEREHPVRGHRELHGAGGDSVGVPPGGHAQHALRHLRQARPGEEGRC